MNAKPSHPRFSGGVQGCSRDLHPTYTGLNGMTWGSQPNLQLNIHASVASQITTQADPLPLPKPPNGNPLPNKYLNLTPRPSPKSPPPTSYTIATPARNHIKHDTHTNQNHIHQPCCPPQKHPPCPNPQAPRLALPTHNNNNKPKQQQHQQPAPKPSPTPPPNPRPRSPPSSASAGPPYPTAALCNGAKTQSTTKGSGVKSPKVPSPPGIPPTWPPC